MTQPSEKTAKKKPYESPKLLVYGDLIQMTKANGKGGNKDGGKTNDLRRTG
jgi:hypothetical protein